MRLIDERGMVLGKINIIDLFVVVFVLSLIPLGFYGTALFHKEEIPETPFFYEIRKGCPICGSAIVIPIAKGNLPKEQYKLICEVCGNEVVVDNKKPVSPIPSYQEQYYKKALEWFNETDKQ